MASTGIPKNCQLYLSLARALNRDQLCWTFQAVADAGCIDVSWKDQWTVRLRWRCLYNSVWLDMWCWLWFHYSKVDFRAFTVTAPLRWLKFSYIQHLLLLPVLLFEWLQYHQRWVPPTSSQESCSPVVTRFLLIIEYSTAPISTFPS